MSIRIKLLIQTLIAIFVVVVFGGASSLWVSANQNKQLVYERMASNLNQLAAEMNQIAENVYTTMLFEIRNPEIIKSSQAANDYAGIEDSFLTESIVNRTIRHLRTVIRNSKYDSVAYYGKDGSLYGYATPADVNVISRGERGETVSYEPAESYANMRFCKEAWIPSEDPAPFPMTIDAPVDNNVRLICKNDQIVFEAKGNIVGDRYDSAAKRFQEEVSGVLLFRKHVTSAMILKYRKQMEVNADFFSIDGRLLAGTMMAPNRDMAPVIEAVSGRRDFFSDLKIDGESYYVLVRPFRFQREPVLNMAAYISRDLVLQNIEHVILLQSAGMLIGLFLAISIALLMEGFISKPIVLIAQQMKRISEEKIYDQKVSIRSKDEIGTLADAFNRMVDMLCRRKEEIDEYIDKMNYINARLKESETKYRALYENAVEGIFQTTRDGVFTGVNPALARILKYDDPDELLRSVKSPISLLHVNVEDPAHIQHTLIDKGRIVGYETQMYRKDGSRVWVSYSARGVYDENGNLEYYEGSLTDITEQKEKERAEKERKEAEAESKAKSEFLANMSHEIRTPLNAILGFTEMMLVKRRSPDFNGYLKSIHFSGKILQRLIEDVLDLSKIEAGKMEIQPEPVNIKTLLAEIEQMFVYELSEKQIELIMEIHENLPPRLMLDLLRIRQILINLIGNALKFTSEGYIRVRNYCNIIDHENRKADIVFEIEDTGAGIPYEEHDAIFESFRQQDGQKTRKHGGTGLGLAITKSLVEMMNGEISVYSEVGKGSIFHVFLSAVEFLETDSDADSYSAEKPPVEFDPATILVVDDIAAGRRLVKDYLGRLANRPAVAEARSGEEAVEILQNEPETSEKKISLVLMDLKLPGKSGYEVTRWIRSIRPRESLPVIAMTALHIDKAELIDDSLFDGYLKKPLSADELIQELKKHLPHLEKKPEIEIPDSGDTDSEPPPLRIPDHVLHRMPDLIQYMENEMTEKWNSLREAYYIDEAEDFALEIIQLSEQYEIEWLTDYGKKLYMIAMRSQIEEISRYIQAFPEIVKQLKIETARITTGDRLSFDTTESP